jgi:hypothetical protein
MVGRVLGGMLVSMELSKEARPMTETLCILQYAVDRVEDCPGARCPFWDETDEAGCIVAPIERVLVEQPRLAQRLLELRMRLDFVRVSAAEPPARSLFYRLLNNEQATDH